MKKSVYKLDNRFKCEIMPHDLSTLNLLRQDINYLSYLYPQINLWYWKTFAQGLYKNERNVLVVRDLDDEFAGFSLLKNTEYEKKLCTFYILPEFRESGIGKHLLPLSIDILGGKDIGITASKLIYPTLQPLLLKNSFTLEDQREGLYKPENTEHIYLLK